MPVREKVITQKSACGVRYAEACRAGKHKEGKKKIGNKEVQNAALESFKSENIWLT